jgi:hypothetical protein
MVMEGCFVYSLQLQASKQPSSKPCVNGFWNSRALGSKFITVFRCHGWQRCMVVKHIRSGDVLSISTDRVVCFRESLQAQPEGLRAFESTGDNMELSDPELMHIHYQANDCRFSMPLKQRMVGSARIVNVLEW